LKYVIGLFCLAAVVVVVQVECIGKTSNHKLGFLISKKKQRLLIKEKNKLNKQNLKRLFFVVAVKCKLKRSKLPVKRFFFKFLENRKKESYSIPSSVFCCSLDLFNLQFIKLQLKCLFSLGGSD